MKEIVVGPNDAGQRLDRFLKKYLANAPLSLVYKIIRKDLKLNGKRAGEDVFLNNGDIIQLYIMDAELENLLAKKKHSHAKRQFTIAYEDEDILVVSKPFGLLTHGDATEKKNTLNNQVIDYLIEKGDYIPRLEKSFTPAPANRLDRNTTGLVAFGKNAKAQRYLTSAFANKESEGGAKKIYQAICLGEIKSELVLEGYLLKDSRTNKVSVFKSERPGSKYIKTIVRPIKTSGKYSYVEVELVTGRTHQIRAHLSSIRHPILGDPKYGSGSAQYLHAGKLILDGKTIESELPREFQDKLRELFR